MSKKYTYVLETNDFPKNFTGICICLFPKGTEESHRAYYKNGKLHREDGPAKIYGLSNKYEYWLDGVQYSESQHKETMRKRNSCDGTLIEIDGKKYKLTLVKE